MKRNSIFKPVVLSCLIFFISCFLLLSQEELTYQMPPKEIAELVDAPRTPSVWVSPDRKTLIILEFPGLQSIEELAQPELKLAGIRINPRTNGPSPGQAFYYNKMTFKDLIVIGSGILLKMEILLYIRDRPERQKAKRTGKILL